MGLASSHIWYKHAGLVSEEYPEYPGFFHKASKLYTLKTVLFFALFLFVIVENRKLSKSILSVAFSCLEKATKTFSQARSRIASHLSALQNMGNPISSFSQQHSKRTFGLVFHTVLFDAERQAGKL